MNTSTPLEIEDLLVHGAWLRKLASSLVVSDGDAEDLVQETWLAALVRGPAQREQARAWLARVLRNKASSRARKSGARQQREENAARQESLPSAAVLAGRADLSRQLVGFVLELSPESQRILLARYFEGLSSAEIARRLGRPTGSVRSQLKRGLDDLRRRLDAENRGERERWLSALAPLVQAQTQRTGLGIVLAASVGVRAAVCLALTCLAAGLWWMNRGPGLDASPITVLSDAGPEELQGPQPAQTARHPSPSEAEDQRVLLRAEPVLEESVIQGRVVHPVSGEAVVWFELGIVPLELAEVFEVNVTASTQVPAPEEMERVRTDDEGRFSSRFKYASGSYALVPIEDWRVARTPVDLSRIRQPRPAQDFQHDVAVLEPHRFELDCGPVFAIDCPKALELGAESMVAIYSYLDHFPPGYFRPSPLQVEPRPFVRMHTDFAASHRNQVSNLRLVSEDGFWSGSVPMTIPDSIATQFIRFDLEARALVEVDLDFGERKPPFYLELQYWQGAVDPTAPDAPEPDIIELQANFDGTDLEQAIVKYVRTGLATVGIKANTSEYWFEVVDLVAGHNALEAIVLPDPAATGRIQGRVVYLGGSAPEPIVRVIGNATLNGEPTFRTEDLEFHEEGGMWVAEFDFTHLPVMAHTIWFDKGGPATNDPKTFAVEPDRSLVEVNGPPVEFELHTDLTSTRLQVKVADALTGDKVRDFTVTAIVPGAWVHSKRAESKAGRARLQLLGKLEGGIVCLAAKGYIRRDVLMSDATESTKGLDLDVVLMPGWGGPVYVKETGTEKPLAGARILLDGVEIGVTDEAGNFQLEVQQAPQRVDFQLDGFEVTGQSGWIDNTGEVISVGPDPTRQYIGVRMRKL